MGCAASSSAARVAPLVMPTADEVVAHDAAAAAAAAAAEAAVVTGEEAERARLLDAALTVLRAAVARDVLTAPERAWHVRLTQLRAYVHHPSAMTGVWAALVAGDAALRRVGAVAFEEHAHQPADRRGYCDAVRDAAACEARHGTLAFARGDGVTMTWTLGVRLPPRTSSAAAGVCVGKSARVGRGEYLSLAGLEELAAAAPPVVLSSSSPLPGAVDAGDEPGGEPLEEFRSLVPSARRV